MRAARTQPSEPVARRQSILSAIDALPSPPASLRGLMALATRGDASVSELSRLIAGDGAVAARIAALGGPESADDVAGAVAQLGADRALTAALAVSTHAFLHLCYGRSNGFDARGLWRHSLATACLCERLAASSPAADARPPEAFAAGLLHDLGKAAMAACVPRSFRRVERLADSRIETACALEQEVIGLDHAVVGRRLAQRWDLPAGLVEAIWLHHQSPEALPASLSRPGLVAAVQLADVICRERQVGASASRRIVTPSDVLAERFGLTPADVETLAGQTLTRMKAWTWVADREPTATTPAWPLPGPVAAPPRSVPTAPPPTPHRAGGVSDAIARFSAALGGYSAAVDVCRAGAEALRSATDGPVAVVTDSGDGRSLEVGVAGADGRGRGLLVRLAEPTPEPFAGVDPQGDFLPLGGAAAAAIGALRDRLAEDLGAAEWAILPLGSAGRVVGLALIADGRRWTASDDAGRRDLRTLAGAVALAVDGARARREADRLSDDLAEVNRRLTELRDQLLAARSLAMIAEMAAGAGHELNNPLAVISGRAQMLLDQTTDPSARRSLATISDQAQRCSQIVTELLDFARPPQPQPRPVALAELCGRLRDRWLARSSLSPEPLAVAVEHGTPDAWADPDQIEQVLDELLANAGRACENRPPPARLTINCRPGLTDDHIVVSVTDNGVGMSPEVVAKACDPFFSSRPAGRGRGLGLARASRLVTANGGTLTFDSTPGVGTTACVRLPTAAGAPAGL